MNYSIFLSPSFGIILVRVMLECPCCGSNNIILDMFRGDCICKDCGVVVEERVAVFEQSLPWIRVEQKL